MLTAKNVITFRVKHSQQNWQEEIEKKNEIDKDRQGARICKAHWYMKEVFSRKELQKWIVISLSYTRNVRFHGNDILSYVIFIISKIFQFLLASVLFPKT